MRSVFIGTVEISWHCLRTILKVDEVNAIYTMPPERSGKISAYKSFDELGASHGVPVFHEAKINEPHVVEQIRAFEPEIIYCIGWPRLVKKELLEMPPKECVGIHSSLLPKYRGGAPVNWGLIHGEREWGVSLMYLGDGPDIGDVIAQEKFPVGEHEDCRDVYAKATEACINLLSDMVPRLANGTAPRIKQNDADATLFFQRKPHEGLVDWTKSAEELHNWVRAMTHPYPGAFTHLPDGRQLNIWRAETLKRTGSSQAPGTILAHHPYQGLEVQAGEGTLLIKSIQPENDDEMPATVWSAHEGPVVGQVLGGVK